MRGVRFEELVCRLFYSNLAVETKTAKLEDPVTGFISLSLIFSQTHHENCSALNKVKWLLSKSDFSERHTDSNKRKKLLLFLSQGSGFSRSNIVPQWSVWMSQKNTICSPERVIRLSRDKNRRISTFCRGGIAIHELHRQQEGRTRENNEVVILAA